jgi:hypothetical protein
VTRAFHYVRHERVPDWLRAGWIARPALEGTSHGIYSALLEWLCDCPEAIPDSATDSHAVPVAPPSDAIRGMIVEAQRKL